MGEIKSTMDIIMEKTKGLTMSKEEKAEYKHRELTGKVRGLIQKFLDGLLDLNKFKMEMTAFSEQQGDAVKQSVVEASIPHIQLGANNEPFFQILGETAHVDVGPLREMESAIMERLDRERVDREKLLKKKLEEKGVSGSAVIPNLKTDPDWKQFLAHEDESFRTKLFSHVKSE